MFTHMVGVSPFDQTETGHKHNQHLPWHHGTLHHVFNGGWLWVIPFDNHDGALSTLCSVGLTLDERVFPKTAPRNANSRTFCAGFRRSRRSSNSKVGAALGEHRSAAVLLTQHGRDRYCLTAHAAGFIDALYSRGLTNTVDVVNSLAHRLIDAKRAEDWSTERFRYVDALQQGLFDVHDDLVYCSFVGFRHYPLWNAVLRVWRATSFLTWLPVNRALTTFREDGDASVFHALEQTGTPGLPGPAGADVAALLAFTRRLCQEVEAGTLAPEQAASDLFARLGDCDFLPGPLGSHCRRTGWVAASPRESAGSRCSPGPGMRHPIASSHCSAWPRHQRPPD